MHHSLSYQESAIKLSILLTFCLRKFSRVKSNYVTTWQTSCLLALGPLQRIRRKAPFLVGLDFILSSRFNNPTYQWTKKTIKSILQWRKQKCWIHFFEFSNWFYQIYRFQRFVCDYQEITCSRFKSPLPLSLWTAVLKMRIIKTLAAD